MKVELIEKISPPVNPNRLNEFPENRWGIIRQWGNHNRYIGKIVKLYKGKLYEMKLLLDGNPEHPCSSWDNFNDIMCFNGNFYIEPIPISAKIEVTI